MSGVPNQEPQAYGLITFRTTFGTIDIELFTKQCPKATRNFVQLCLDDYYKGTLFERVEKDFIAIGGYSPQSNTEELSSFPDEFHSRLKFTRRGLLATANEGKNDNGPKFFFTLGATPELQNKHTIFGRAKGNSVYTLVDLNECSVDEHCRPYSEQKIEEVVVVDNPFQDLVPRLRPTHDGALESDSSSEEEYYDPLAKPKQNLTKVKKLSFDFGDDDDSNNESESEKPNGLKELADTRNNLRIGTGDTKNELIDQKSNIPDATVRSTRTLDDPEVPSNPPTGTETSADDKEKRRQEIRAQIEAIKKQMEDSVAKKKSSKRRLEDDSCEAKVEDSSFMDEEFNRALPARDKKDRQRKTIELVANFRKKLKQVSKADKTSQACSSDHAGLSLGEMDELDIPDGDEWLNHRFEPAEDLTEPDDRPRRERNNYETHKHDSRSRRSDRDHDRHSSRDRHRDGSTRSHKSRRH